MQGEELSNLYFSLSINRIIAPRSIWEYSGHRREVHEKFDRKTSYRDHYEDIDIGCMIILKMLKR